MTGVTLQELNYGVSSESTSWKIIHCMQFLSCKMCGSKLSLKFLYAKWHSTYSEYWDQTMPDNLSGPLIQEVKNKWKLLNRQPWNVVRATYNRLLLTRGSNCKALTGETLVFWIGGHLREVGAYERWSLMEAPL